ncbi:MAG: hypothetical protein ACE5KP_01210 [Dehalococcoidales bacterium]
MGITAAIVGAVGGLCAIMGIVTAAEVIPLIMPQFTWTFWFLLAAILLLVSIVFALGRSYE